MLIRIIKGQISMFEAFHIIQNLTYIIYKIPNFSFADEENVCFSCCADGKPLKQVL